jgi:hypothetical protein
MQIEPTTEIDGALASDQTWLASSHGIDAARSVTFDVSAFTEGTHYPDGFLPGGLPVVPGESGPYEPYVDESESTPEFLLDSVRINGGVDPSGAVISHCKVNADRLPVATDLLSGWYPQPGPPAAA